MVQTHGDTRPSVGSALPTGPSGSGTRGRPQGKIFGLRSAIPATTRTLALLAGAVCLLALWVLASSLVSNDGFSVPTIGATWQALVEMQQNGTLVPDLLASTRRVAIGYTVSIVIGVGLGLLIGSFATVDAFFEPQLGFLRYIPATALTPLFLIWLGIDEAPKIALIVVGTVFYNILMVADVVRAVPSGLIKASYTMGAGRFTVLRRVIVPYAWPGMVDVARINLAAGWLMLVVAELLAGKDGLAFRISNAQRFRAIDRMFALLLIFGLLGIVLDLALRTLRNRTAKWAVDQ